MASGPSGILAGQPAMASRTGQDVSEAAVPEEQKGAGDRPAADADGQPTGGPPAAGPTAGRPSRSTGRLRRVALLLVCVAWLAWRYSLVIREALHWARAVSLPVTTMAAAVTLGWLLMGQVQWLAVRPAWAGRGINARVVSHGRPSTYSDKHQVNGENHLLPIHNGKGHKTSRHVYHGIDGKLHIGERINP